MRFRLGSVLLSLPTTTTTEARKRIFHSVELKGRFVGLPSNCGFREIGIPTSASYCAFYCVYIYRYGLYTKNEFLYGFNIPLFRKLIIKNKYLYEWFAYLFDYSQQ